MKSNRLKMVLINLLFIALLIACNEKAATEYVDAIIAKEELSKELDNPNSMFRQGDLMVTSIGINEETNTLEVGLLVLNKETEKEFKATFFKDILHHKEVKLKLVQQEPAAAH
ncbi:hypothetical protein AB1K89_06045 [Sporosarcina sp. 179-K 8C2 HS]|uniref:hypothetical protein n=1 Tax=Sporosarcina sp. 179-K 8C2 HS TaxID=3142387 RepID=UPI00399EEFF9